VAALWPQWSWGEPLWQVARLLLAISAMLLARRIAGGVAMPTLAGVLAFGLLSWWWLATG